MRIVRRFYTSNLSRAKQTLYEPYVAPLNQEQKKALRKLMLRGQPHVNPRVSRDIEHLLQHYSVTASIQERRKLTIDRVQKIITNAFGPGYSIMDMSLYRYARDIDGAPLELSIVDTSRPRGFSPGTEHEPLPPPYDPEVLASILSQEGYTGHFFGGDAEIMVPQEQKRILPVHEDRGSFVRYPSWPTMSLPPTTYLSYPPVLYAQPRLPATLPFHLSPPIPVHQPLINLLQTYCKMASVLPDLISFLFLWFRSIGLSEVTPVCVALMVIGAFQHKNILPSLQNPKDPRDLHQLANANEGVWIRAELPPSHPPDTFWIETGFMKKNIDDMKYLRGRRLSRLIFEFFEFWSQLSLSEGVVASDQAVSVREGALIPRPGVVKGGRRMVINNRQNIQKGIIPWEPLKPPVVWKVQPIVVQDPFIPTYNHARMLTKEAAINFEYMSSLARRTVFHGHPLIAIMGPQTTWTAREYSTSTLNQEAKEMYDAMIPPLPIISARRQTMERVQRVIRNSFGDQFTVEVFGSTRYGVSTASSDLDLVVLDPRYPFGYSSPVPKDKPDVIYNMRSIARALSKNGFTQVFAIPKAKVPIVKFHDPRTGLDCDLNANDRLGLLNSNLIRAYCDLAPNLVRPMMLTIKLWAKSHGLNDPSGQNGPVSFSSYALALMVIGYLQAQGTLPNLQAGLTPLKEKLQPGTWRHQLSKRRFVQCDVRFMVPSKWVSGADLTLGDALLGWFNFWGNEFDYGKHSLSIRAGNLLQRPDNAAMKTLTKSNKKRKKGKGKEEENEGGNEPKGTLELLGERNLLDEDSALAAWKDQQDELVHLPNETVKLEHFEGTKVFEMTTNNEIGESITRQSQMGARADVPSSSDLELSSSEVFDSDSDSNLEGAHPSTWLSDSLIVADPFVALKNVTAAIKNTQIMKFWRECRHAALLIQSGTSLEDLIMEGKSAEVEPARQQLGRRGRRGWVPTNAGRGGRGRGNHSKTDSKDRRPKKLHEKKHEGNPLHAPNATAGPSTVLHA